MSSESEKRLTAIEKRVRQFLDDPEIKTFWGEDAEIPYTILRTGPKSCKIVWDDGVTMEAPGKGGGGQGRPR